MAQGEASCLESAGDATNASAQDTLCADGYGFVCLCSPRMRRTYPSSREPVGSRSGGGRSWHDSGGSGRRGRIWRRGRNLRRIGRLRRRGRNLRGIGRLRRSGWKLRRIGRLRRSGWKLRRIRRLRRRCRLWRLRRHWCSRVRRNGRGGGQRDYGGGPMCIGTYAHHRRHCHDNWHNGGRLSVDGRQPGGLRIRLFIGWHRVHVARGLHYLQHGCMRERDDGHRQHRYPVRL
jgi:hypothetical protein